MNKIPKIAYFYWGAPTMPFLRYLTLYSFKKQNPDWKLVLYKPKILFNELTWISHEQKYEIKTEEDYFNKIYDIGVEVRELDVAVLGFSNSISEVFKSDILRLHLLSTSGGLWSDMDIIYFKPIEKGLPNNDADVFICCHGFHSIGLLLACQNNLFFKNIYSKARTRLDIKNYQAVGSTLYGQIFGTSFGVICDNFKNQNHNVHNIPFEVVYPCDDLNRMSNDKYSALSHCIKDNTVGLHWYAGHPLTGSYINLISEKNYRNYDNLISHAVSLALEG
jgi:hypothetical protein